MATTEQHLAALVDAYYGGGGGGAPMAAGRRSALEGQLLSLKRDPRTLAPALALLRAPAHAANQLLQLFCLSVVERSATSARVVLDEALARDAAATLWRLASPASPSHRRAASVLAPLVRRYAPQLWPPHVAALGRLLESAAWEDQAAALGVLGETLDAFCGGAAPRATAQQRREGAQLLLPQLPPPPPQPGPRQPQPPRCHHCAGCW